MFVGILTALFGDWDLERVFQFAAKVGYDAVEIAAWPWSKHLKLDEVIAETASEVKDKAESNNLKITALTCHVNHLEPSLSKREELNNHFKKVMDAASALDVPVVTAVSGSPIPGNEQEDNFEEFSKVMGSLVEYATDKGIKIGIEAFSPNLVFNIPTIERMFDIIPSQTLGLNFDPSHFVWQGIDYLEVVRRFGHRIYHSHAKDTEVMDNVLRLEGVNGRDWWRFRIPGWGQVDWKKLITTYRDIGYDNVISFEHEDPTIGAEEGAKKVADFLNKLV